MATSNTPRFDRDGALSRNYRTRVGRSTRRISRPAQRNITPLYTKFEAGDIVENAQADTITAAMWTNNDGELIAAGAPSTSPDGASEIYTSSISVTEIPASFAFVVVPPQPLDVSRFTLPPAFEFNAATILAFCPSVYIYIHASFT